MDQKCKMQCPYMQMMMGMNMMPMYQLEMEDAGDANNILKIIKKNNPIIIRSLISYGIPRETADEIVLNIVNITLKYSI